MNKISGPFQKRLLVRIAAALMAVTLLTLTAFAILFSRIYVDAARESLAREYERSLQEKLDELESIESYVTDVHRMILADSDVAYFLRTPAVDPIDEYKARNMLRRITALSPGIHSLSLCNPHVDWCISTVLPSAGSSEFENNVPRVDTATRRVAIPQVIGPPVEPPTDIVSLYYFSGEVIESAPGMISRALIIVNLRDQFGVEKEFGSPFPFFAVLDEEMRLVGRRASEGGSDAASLIAELISDAPTAGHFVTSLDGRQVYVSYQRSSLLDWTLLRVDSDAELRSEIVTVRNRLIIGLALAILLATVLSLLLSRGVYSPVAALLKKIQDTHSTALGAENTDLSVILHSLTDLTRQVSLLEQERSFDRETLRSEFLSRLCSEPVSSETFRSERQRLRVRLEDSDFLVIVIHIRSIAREDPERSKVLLTGLLRITTELLSALGVAEVFTNHGREVCVLLSEVHAIADEDLTGQLNALVKSVAGLLGAEIVVGVGSPVESHSEISDSYRDAAGIVDHALTLEGAWVHTRDSLTKALVSAVEYPVATEHALETALRIGDRTEFLAGVATIIESLTATPYAASILALNRLSLVLVHSANEMLAGVGSDPLVEPRRANLDLSLLQSLEDWRRWMTWLFDNVHAVVSEASSGKREVEIRTLVTETIRYVEENYSDSGLYGESVAEHFGYSPSHFAKLFRDATGRSVADHLREYRVSRAKEMLAGHSRTTVKEVARAVGFSNINYFYQVFKKMVGVTPAVFKELPAAHETNLSTSTGN